MCEVKGFSALYLCPLLLLITVVLLSIAHPFRLGSEAVLDSWHGLEQSVSLGETGTAEPKRKLEAQSASSGGTGAAGIPRERLTSPWTGVAGLSNPNKLRWASPNDKRGLTGALGVYARELNNFLRYTGKDFRESPADQPPKDPKSERLSSKPSQIRLGTKSIVWICVAMSAIAISFLICSMMRPGDERDSTSHRVPPRWNPEHENTYSFRNYMIDVMLWSMLTDLAPYQQAAAIILRLGGAARELARTLTPLEIAQGGIINGQALDPVSYILYGLHARFAQLGEETRLAAMTDMMSFQRRPGEHINAVLTRYEIVRQRARNEGQFVMSTEGCALQILRACGVSTNQMMTLLQPFGTNLPRNETELASLTAEMRRMGHIIENTPGNIASSLHGPRTGRTHLLTQAFMGTESTAVRSYHSSQGWSENTNENHEDPNNQLWRDVRPAPEGPQQTYVSDQWTAAQGNPTQTMSDWYQDTTPPWEQQGYWETPSYLANHTDNWHSGQLWEEEQDSGTDSDTSSDSGRESIDMSDLHAMDHAEASAHVFWQYRQAKRKWRRLTNKPVRKFRRMVRRTRRTKGKGKGKGKFGKGKPFFHAEAYEAVLTYLKGRGKGGRSFSSGKGAGRRKNPMGRDGQVMRCRNCNSDEHFAAKCPRSASSSSAPPQMFVIHDEDGPISNILANQADNTQVHIEEIDEATSQDQTFAFPVFPGEGTDPVWQGDPWSGLQQETQSRTTGKGKGKGDRMTGTQAYQSDTNGAPQENQESEFLRSAQRNRTDARQPSALGRTGNISDESLRHILLGNSMVADLRQQSRQHVRNQRERRGPEDNRMPLHGIPAIFQRMAQAETEENIPRETTQSSYPSDFPESRFIVPNEQSQERLFPPNTNRGRTERTSPPPTQPEAETIVASDQSSNIDVPVIYDGDDRTCTICLSDFEHGQRVLRLRCRHVFHTECWERQLYNWRERSTVLHPECPNCRGVGNVIAVWKYLDPSLLTQPGAPNEMFRPTAPPLSALSRSRRQSTPGTPESATDASEYGTPASTSSHVSNTYGRRRSRSHSIRRPSFLEQFLILPSTYLDAREWEVTETLDSPVVTQDSGQETTRAFHSETRLPDGRPVLLIDPGSVGNLCGDVWAQECAKEALKHGRNPVQTRRNRPLSVMGVGNGNQTCTHNCTIHVALTQLDGTGSVGTYTTPVVANSKLPGLLGLNTMRKNRGVLDMINLQLHMCGPGDVQVTLPPGTKSYQLEVSPSGHLVLPCSNFPGTTMSDSTPSEVVLQTTEMDATNESFQL